MADKPEFVDMISDATRQIRRRATPVMIEPEVKKASRLAHRPARLALWRIENLTPWKLKTWKFKGWD